MAHLIFALALLAHGIGHVLFVANAWGYWTVGAGRGALLAQALHLGQPVERLLGLLWLLPLAGFTLGAWAFYTQAAGWPLWLLVSAALSAALIVAGWGSINVSSALFALLFNLIVVAVALWQRQGAPLAG